MNNYDGFKLIKNILPTTCQYYRSTLKPEEINCYDKIVLGIVNYDKSIQLSGIDVSKIGKIFNSIKMDNPLLFFVKELSIKYETNFNRIIIIPQYRFNRKTTNDNIVALLSKVKSILLSFQNTDDFNAEKKIHDYLCNTAQYDVSFAESSYECVGPILFNKGVCEGISKAAKLLCDILRIKCIVIHGISTESQFNFGTNAHTWNKICIDGVFYNLDITFDMTISSNNFIRYDYFNLSDYDVLKDHQFNNEVTPLCINNGCYYSMRNQAFSTIKEIRNYLCSEIMKNNKNIVFKVLNNDTSEIIEKKIIHCVNDVLRTLKKHRQQYQYSFNKHQGIIQIELL